MLNLTSYGHPYDRPSWIVAQVIWTCYFTLAVYLFSALLIYLFRHRHEPQVTRRRGLFMYGFVTAAFILAIVEMGVNEWGILHMMESSEICEGWRQAHHLAYFTSLVPGYIFLWIRQHAFYGDAMLKTMTNRKLATYSWVVLAALFIGYGFFMVYFGSPAYTDSHEYVIEDMACYSGKHKKVSAIFYSCAITLLVFYQSSLLFLFTYPIWKSSQEDGSVSETMMVIMGYIKKCRLLTLITAGTDIFAFLCSVVLKRLWNAPLTVLTIIYDIDLLINLFCLLLCLKPWKDIVIPYREKRRSKSVYAKERHSFVNSDGTMSQSGSLKYIPVSRQLSNSSTTSTVKTALSYRSSGMSPTMTRMESLPEDNEVFSVQIQSRN